MKTFLFTPSIKNPSRVEAVTAFLRRRLRIRRVRGVPPCQHQLTENSFGNLFQMVLGERGFEAAKENFMEISKLLAKWNGDVFRFSSMCRFPVYEADFGWGKPVWVSYAGVPNKNCVFLFDSGYAWVVLTPQAMERLQGDLQFLHITIPTVTPSCIFFDISFSTPRALYTSQALDLK